MEKVKRIQVGSQTVGGDGKLFVMAGPCVIEDPERTLAIGKTMKAICEKLGLTYMFIAHDLNIVKYISDRIAVMYLGNLVELAPSDDIYAHTLHPYSQALLASVPIPDPNKEAQKRAQVLSGDVPSPINPKPGCKFAGRCPHATDRCRSETPVLREVRPNHFVACHLVQPE